MSPPPLSPFLLLDAVRDEMNGSGAVITLAVEPDRIWVDARAPRKTMRLALMRERYEAMEPVDAVAWACAFRREWDRGP